ncbi:uncharacterized protein PSFLO_07170 [Pseudozyma flocculosa]|uniref:Uncharacterized protein n=1 Tax=Pseudozyma flocculosa TaxID=84751 RepID=A0A5C3FBC5_9BASI|nr:uncharacterized protein PSFLO_07170 [Pseudozyma flocculosa]
MGPNKARTIWDAGGRSAVDDGGGRSACVSLVYTTTSPSACLLCELLYPASARRQADFQRTHGHTTESEAADRPGQARPGQAGWRAFAQVQSVASLDLRLFSLQEVGSDDVLYACMRAAPL